MTRKKKIRRKASNSTGIFVRALVKVDHTTRRAILNPRELKEWLTYARAFSKRSPSVDALAKVMKSAVKSNADFAARKKR